MNIMMKLLNKTHGCIVANCVEKNLFVTFKRKMMLELLIPEFFNITAS